MVTTIQVTKTIQTVTTNIFKTAIPGTKNQRNGKLSKALPYESREILEETSKLQLFKE